MKRMTCLITLIFSVVLFSTALADTITIRADNWCPYNCVPGSKSPGYTIEIASLIFAKAGHNIDYQTKPWSRAIDEARKGLVNGVVGALVGDAPDFVFPEEAFGMMHNSFWIRKGYDWQFNDVASLKKVRLGIIQDYDYGETITAYIKNNNDKKLVQSLSSDTALDQNIKKLLANRIDVIVEDDNVFRFKLAELGKEGKIDQAVLNNESSGGEKLYMAFSPANPKSKEYASLLSKGIKEMRSSGELSSILAKYGLSDWALLDK